MFRRQLFSTSGLLVAAVALAPLWVALSAEAQTAPGQAAQATTLGEVIVTAQRRAENLQKVPISVTALSGGELKKQQVDSAFDLQFNVPNLTVANMQEGGRQGQTFVIRGQATQADDAPPGVVEYLDDVPVQSQEIARSYYDMSSIQVLEGPQGTLFGRNTNGGAVLFTPNKPTNTFGGYITGQYGNYNDGYGEAVVNLPVIPDVLAIRVAGNIERRDGFTKNIAGPAVDNLNYETWRVGIDFKPNNMFENYTLLNGESAHEHGPGYVLTDAAPCTGPSENASCFFNKAAALNPLIPNNPYLGLGLVDFTDAFHEQQALGNRTIDSPFPSSERENGFGVANTSTLTLGNLTFKNIIGYHVLNTNNFNHFDDTPDMALGVNSSIHYKTFTEEFQVLGHTDDNFFRWIAGVNYFHQNQDPYSDTNPYLGSDNAQVALPLLLDEAYFIHLRLKSFALYGQGTVDLSRWVHGLSFTGGYRYTWDTPSLTDSIYEIVGPLSVLRGPPTFIPPGTYCAFGPGACPVAASAKYNAPNWSLSLNEQLNDHLMVYVASRHGYKSGGFNTTTTDAQDFSYAPEKLTDLEGGVKSDFRLGDTAVRFNADVFYDWYTNLQLGNVVFFNGSPASIIENACLDAACPDHLPSSAHLYGGEASLTVAPTRSLSLTVSYGYQKGVYDHFLELQTSGAVVNQSGNAFAALPEHTLSAAATWHLPIDPQLGDLALTGTVSYRSSFNLSLDATNASAVSGYALVNARLDWTHVAGHPIDASLFVKNLGNYTYPLGFVAGGAFGFDGRYYGEPRMFGVSLTYHFGG